ncbi:hypothetical protein SEEC0006_24356 [Salmonella enterica subsp. enterica serovar Choleraesuis str. 0006]|nr:hypothetical protein SEEC0006_24356 [Salmonella enterica subsp. enterica serovar Choleraesuis str. 0006]
MSHAQIRNDMSNKRKEEARLRGERLERERKNSAEWRRFNQSGGATLTPANKKRYTGAALSP